MLRKFFWFFLLLCFSAHAVTSSRAGIAFAPGYLTAQGVIAYGVAVQWELPLALKLSIRSDAYTLLVRPQASSLTQNYQAFVGLAYQFDQLWIVTPYAGFQPGFGLGAVNAAARPDLKIYPAMSPVFGMRVAVAESLECDLALRYVFGEMSYRDTGAVYLSELRLGAGLTTRL